MKANDRQEAGTHYRQKAGVPQHWDLSRMFKWDPMQYQIIKYVMRWKDKHATPEKRLEDLKKARHFLDKYIEDYAEYDDHHPDAPAVASLFIDSLLPGDIIHVEPGAKPPGLSTRFLHPNDPAKVTVDVNWQCEGWYGDMTNLYRCKHCRSLFRTENVERAIALHGTCPQGKGYVNQDQ